MANTAQITANSVNPERRQSIRPLTWNEKLAHLTAKGCCCDVCGDPDALYVREIDGVIDVVLCSKHVELEHGVDAAYWQAVRRNPNRKESGLFTVESK